MLEEVRIWLIENHREFVSILTEHMYRGREVRPEDYSRELLGDSRLVVYSQGKRTRIEDLEHKTALILAILLENPLENRNKIMSAIRETSYSAYICIVEYFLWDCILSIAHESMPSLKYLKLDQCPSTILQSCKFRELVSSGNIWFSKHLRPKVNDFAGPANLRQVEVTVRYSTEQKLYSDNMKVVPVNVPNSRIPFQRCDEPIKLPWFVEQIGMYNSKEDQRVVRYEVKKPRDDVIDMCLYYDVEVLKNLHCGDSVLLKEKYNVHWKLDPDNRAINAHAINNPNILAAREFKGWW